MSISPKIFFGMVLYNADKYLPAALDSILNQTYADFQIIASDDCSSDNTEEIMRHYASIDPRITYIKNEKRLGMIMNKRKVFFEATQRGADYFAWAADHDLWHTEWVQAHVSVLNKYPEVVMTYPLTAAIGPEDERLSIKPARFETVGMSKMERVRAACTKMAGAGDMIYGLFRASALKKCGVFPFCAMPDRLLLLEMSVYGAFKQIDKELWYRRYPKPKPDYNREIERQRFSLFPEGAAPWHSNFPVLGQALGLVYHLSLRPPSGSYANAHLGPYMAYLQLSRKRAFLREDLKRFIGGLRSKQRHQLL